MSSDLEAGDPLALLQHCSAAARKAPNDLSAQLRLARAALNAQNIEALRMSVADLSQRFPDVAATRVMAGHLAKATGDSEAAADHYRQALEVDADNGEALYNWVDCGAPPPDHALAIHIAELAGQENLEAATRINAGFAHARILDAAGAFDESFSALRSANDLARDTLARRGVIYDPDAIDRSVAERSIDHAADCFRHWLPAFDAGITPLFVVGLPRSGSTLVERILASHPQVAGGGELTIARHCEQAFALARRNAGREGPVDPLDPVDQDLLARARERYLDALFERGFDDDRVVDKLPANFEIAGFLRQIFPDAPIIHTIRDPRATCFSLYAANFAAFEPWYHDLDHMAHYYAAYRRLMTHWQASLPGPFVDVVYEALVTDPENQIRALLEGVGLTFDSACLTPHELTQPVLTASHRSVRRPIHDDAVNHWQHYRPWLGPLIDLPSLEPRRAP